MMIFRDFSDFSIAGNNWKKKLIIMKKKKNGAEPGWLLPMEHEAGRWAGAGRAAGVRRACAGRAGGRWHGVGVLGCAGRACARGARTDAQGVWRAAGA